MKRLLFLVAISWLILLPIQAQSQDNLPNALLWEISGGDLKHSSYLYGTIHMIDRQDFYLSDSLKKAIADAQKVVFEINLESMNDMTAMMGIMMKAFMPDNISLEDLLSPEEYQIVVDHFEAMGLPMMFLNRIKPMFLSVLASNDMSYEEGGGITSANTVSYEMEIMKIAQAREKPFDGLETLDFQMSMFDSIPYEVQAQMLVETIQEETGEDGGKLDTLVLLYKQQNLNGMESLFQSDQSGLAEFEDLLLNKRNNNWIPVMRSMMSEGTTLFAVGAGHLVGKRGVIRLLEAEGYTLKPIPFDWPEN